MSEVIRVNEMELIQIAQQLAHVQELLVQTSSSIRKEMDDIEDIVPNSHPAPSQLQEMLKKTEAVAESSEALSHAVSHTIEKWISTENSIASGFQETDPLESSETDAYYLTSEGPILAGKATGANTNSNADLNEAEAKRLLDFLYGKDKIVTESSILWWKKYSVQEGYANIWKVMTGNTEGMTAEEIRMYEEHVLNMLEIKALSLASIEPNIEMQIQLQAKLQEYVKDELLTGYGVNDLCTDTFKTIIDDIDLPEISLGDIDAMEVTDLITDRKFWNIIYTHADITKKEQIHNNSTQLLYELYRSDVKDSQLYENLFYNEAIDFSKVQIPRSTMNNISKMITRMKQDTGRSYTVSTSTWNFITKK